MEYVEALESKIGMRQKRYLPIQPGDVLRTFM